MGVRETGLSGSFPDISSIRLTAVLKWWPLIVGAMVIALSGAWWAKAHEVASYSSTARLVVAPLPQWDETFLGTDLVRDSGDATRTTSTLAAELKSDHYAAVTAGRLGSDWTAQSVASAVSVASPGEMNIIEITARSTNPDTAKKLASGFADAVTADRWQTIAAQLDSKIATIRSASLVMAGDQQGANPSAGEQAGRLQTLTIVRDSGADPTLRIAPTDRAMRAPGMSLTVALILASLGGAFVGVLSALALEALRRGTSRPAAPAGRPAPQLVVRSSNGSGHADAKSR